LTRFKSVNGKQRMLIQLHAYIRSFFFFKKYDHKSADNENNNGDDDDESSNFEEIKFSWLFTEQFLIRTMSQRHIHICLIIFFLILFIESVMDGTVEGVSQAYTHTRLDKIHSIYIYFNHSCVKYCLADIWFNVKCRILIDSH